MLDKGLLLSQLSGLFVLRRSATPLDKVLPGYGSASIGLLAAGLGTSRITAKLQQSRPHSLLNCRESIRTLYSGTERCHPLPIRVSITPFADIDNGFHIIRELSIEAATSLVFLWRKTMTSLIEKFERGS
jgi:hypothetical protein